MSRPPFMSANRATEKLLKQGYCIIPDAVPAQVIASLVHDLDPVFYATRLAKVASTDTRRSGLAAFYAGLATSKRW